MRKSKVTRFQFELQVCQDKNKFYFSTVVIQPYETDVGKEYVILGNDALMKCQIPSFVADSVSVFSWTSSEDELKFYTQENAQGNLEKNNQNECQQDFNRNVFVCVWEYVSWQWKFPRLYVVSVALPKLWHWYYKSH